MNKRTSSCDGHHHNNHDWMNKVGSGCKSGCKNGCKNDYALNNGGRQCGMKNEICVHNVVARRDDEWVVEDHGV